MVCGEGPRRRAAGNGMHHRGFNFEVALGDHESADFLHDAAAREEGLARVLVGDEIGIEQGIDPSEAGGPCFGERARGGFVLGAAAMARGEQENFFDGKKSGICIWL